MWFFHLWGNATCISFVHENYFLSSISTSISTTKKLLGSSYLPSVSPCVIVSIGCSYKIYFHVNIVWTLNGGPYVYKKVRLDLIPPILVQNFWKNRKGSRKADYLVRDLGVTYLMNWHYTWNSKLYSGWPSGQFPITLFWNLAPSMYVLCPYFLWNFPLTTFLPILSKRDVIIHAWWPVLFINL